MVDYQKEVEQEAKDFIENHDEEIKKRILAGRDIDDDDHDWYFSDAIHEDITDRGYSLEDALFVLQNADNTESDTGLWEGQEPLDAIRTMATYTFSNDARSEIENLYNTIKEEFESKLDDIKANEKNHKDDHKCGTCDGSGFGEGKEDCYDCDGTGLSEEGKEAVLIEVINENIAGEESEPVDKGSEEEKDLLVRWLKMGANAGLWSGYPLGSSYIDSRCGTGFGMPEIADYVNFDHQVAAQVPHLSGKYKETIQAYLADTFGIYPERYCGEISKSEKFIVERLVKADKHDHRDDVYGRLGQRFNSAKEAGDYVRAQKKGKFRIVREVKRLDIIAELDRDSQNKKESATA